MGREVEGGFGMENTRIPVVDSCWCMAKPIQYFKVKKNTIKWNYFFFVKTKRKMSIFMIHQIFTHNLTFVFCFCLWKHLNLWPQVYFTKLFMEDLCVCVCVSLCLLLLLIYMLYNLYIVMKLVVLSHAQLFATLWIIAHQAPLSTEFSRQKY